MTRNEKKAVIESMAEKFMNIDDLEGKSMTIMVMSAYAEGKAAGSRGASQMGAERSGCSRLMKTPRHGGGAYIQQEHENKRKRTTIAVVVLDLTDCVSRYH